MSKEFGLDWKKYENKRMSEFMLIMTIENDLNNKNGGRSNIKGQGRGSG